uniref:Uncharacterized protein n=1 Tax=Ciona savignyi TaxID=51511 RepID=H2YHX5_CIOSA
LFLAPAAKCNAIVWFPVELRVEINIWIKFNLNCCRNIYEFGVKTALPFATTKRSTKRQRACSKREAKSLSSYGWNCCHKNTWQWDTIGSALLQPIPCGGGRFYGSLRFVNMFKTYCVPSSQFDSNFLPRSTDFINGYTSL